MPMESKWSLALLLALAGASIACGSESPSEPAPTPCTYTLSPSTLAFEASGGSGSVTVTTGANCTWTAASDRGWMSITGGSSSTGAGMVSVAVTANEGTDARTGTLTIAGQSVPVTQKAASVACTYDLAPASAAYGKDAGSGSFTLTAPAGGQWAASTTDGWISVSAPASGTGSGTVT